MGHSIAAKYAARPAAHFVRPSSRARERRLGLVAVASFYPATRHVTELRGPVRSPALSLRSGWRGPDPARSIVREGRIRPAVQMRWTAPGRAAAGRRPSAATAPWRA